jgi:gliding motility-associated lipoprotein GldH
MLRNILLLLFISLVFTGCLRSPYFQKQVSIPSNKWEAKFQPSFKFEISDTQSLYNMYFLIRHTEAYPYSNVWLWIHTKAPGDTTYTKSRIEIPLADPSGKWLGRGMGEIWEQRMPITHEGDSLILRKAGTWEIKLEQNMRINPLPEILQVGLRVEKNTGDKLADNQ